VPQVEYHCLIVQQSCTGQTNDHYTTLHKDMEYLNDSSSGVSTDIESELSCRIVLKVKLSLC
jgi:hypothetical protein